MSIEHSVQKDTPFTLPSSSFAFAEKPNRRELFLTSEISKVLRQTRSDIFRYVIHSKDKVQTGDNFWRVHDHFGRWNVYLTPTGLRSVSFYNEDGSLAVTGFKAWTNGTRPAELYKPHFKHLGKKYRHDVTIDLHDGMRYFIDEDLEKTVVSKDIVLNHIFPPNSDSGEFVRVQDDVTEQDKSSILQALVTVSLLSRNIPTYKPR